MSWFGRSGRCWRDCAPPSSRFDAAPEQQQALDSSIEQLDELFLLVSSASSTPARARSSTRSSAAGRAGRGDADDGADQRAAVRRDDRPAGPRAGAPRHHRARAAPPRNPHRRHARHQRDHPRARGDHRRVRAALGSRAVRDLRGPAVHRDRARVSRAGPRLGQEGRRRHQQDRHPRRRARRSRRSAAFVADNARALLGFSPEIFPVSARLALRAKQGEPAVWAASRFEALERYIRDDARCARPRAAEAARIRSASAPR